MSKASQRRQAEQQTRLSQNQQYSAKFQVVVHCGDGYPPDECIASLPEAMIQGIQVVVKPNTAVDYDRARMQIVDPGLSRAEARQKGAARGNVQNILFIDADCRLEDPAMLNIALAHLANGAAAVGGLLVDHKDQAISAGFAFSIVGQPYLRFAGWPAGHPKVQKGRMDLQAVPFAFLATRRSVFAKLGLRKEFGEMPYADVDYCCRARHLKMPIVYDPAIRVQSSGQLMPQPNEQALQLLLMSARPAYDEPFLLT